MENKEFQTLILSLILHGLLAWFLMKAPSFQMPEQPTQITMLDDDRSKTIHPTKSLELPDKLLEKKLREQAKILSQLDRRVRQQLTAKKLSGITQNAGRGNSNSKGGSSVQQFNPFQSQSGEGQMSRRTSPALGAEGLGRFMAVGASSSGITIPGVKQGSFTALNTDQLTFYSFYSRVNEGIVNRWIGHLRDYFSMLPPAMQKQLALSPNITGVEIILSPAGEFQRAVMHHPSGDTNLDQAVTNAFKEAAPFLNPPREMVKEDGKIHLLYQFEVLAH